MKKILCFAFCLYILISGTGCWDSREINDLSFVMAMGLEEAENGNLKVTVQIAKASELTPGVAVDQKPYWVISGEGRNTFEAIRNLSLRTPRRLYFAHNQVIVFDEKLAQDGVTKHLDFLLRNFELRQNVWIFVSQGLTPEEVLNYETEIESIPAIGLTGIIQRQGANDKTGVRTLQEFMRVESEPGSTACGVLRIVQSHDFPQGDIVSPPAEGSPQAMQDLFIEGTAVFLDNKLETILDGSTSMGYRLVTNQTEQGLIVFQCPFDGNEEEHITLEIVRSTVALQGKLESSPSILVDMGLKVFLGELQCPNDIMDPENIQIIERAAEKKVIKLMSQAVTQTQAAKSDIMGFGQAMAMHDKQWWRDNRVEWSEIYPATKVEYVVEVRIFSTEIRVQQRGD